MSAIITVTMNASLDTSSAVDRVVAEHKLRCSRPIFEAGGGGLNVARALRRLGGDVLALWTCGGHTGQIMREQLEHEGLHHEPIFIARNTRQSLIINEAASHLQYRFQFPGPSLSPEEIESAFERVIGHKRGTDFLVLSGSLPGDVPEDFYARIAQAQPTNCRVIVDTRGGALHRTLEAGVYLAKPNLRELGELVGRPIDEDASIIDASRRLIDEGRAEVVVTSLGAGGAMLVSAEHVEAVRSPTVPVRSKVGAGDSMVAGITLGLWRGWSLPEAVRFGVAAGAAAVMTPGTQLCRREDTEQLYAKMNQQP